MLKTRPAKEVLVRMPNAIGALDKMAKTIAETGVNLLAVSAWVEHDEAIIRLLTDDDVRLLDTLRAHKYPARETDVLTTELPHRPGMLHRITDRLAQSEIDIHHLYTAPGPTGRCLVVFQTANNDRAMVLLNATRAATTA